ncbi:MAG: hypothetical protein A3H61_00300 [Candidatus Jacksonbacteria bacterium RIFCSPLOWO2_02_FULL_44_20]|uniref:Uncharacterized protein n=1 Tax=Candidatus Jacksonbacteria bacterium RIFCSPLOWO2_02_FULL_44_20 TaxID=1798460 RepID=A0A1G2AA31_9BACT|nr:MAG: hypothetical protein A3H61_00300 [Candidatus Jacksonbacteria bacterium RIFCSPLOWO2_02_FULL_44_20]
MLSARPCPNRAKLSPYLGSAKKFFEENFSLVRLVILRGHIFVNTFRVSWYNDNSCVLSEFQQ